jgi:hypothetical protein
MELIVIDKCLAANLDGFEPVNFRDLAILAEYWHGNCAGTGGDVDGDNKVDLNDLAIVAETWLYNCYP